MADKVLKASYILDATGVTRGVSQADKSLSGLDAKGKQLSESFDKNTSHIGGAFSKLGNSMGAIGLPFAASMDKIGTSFEKAKTGAGTWGQALSDAGKVATVGLVGAGVAVATESVKMAADFQQSMSKLVTSGGEAQANLKGDMAGVEQLMGETGTSASQLAAGLYTINSAGFHGAQGLTVLKAAAQGAKTENADVATVTDGLTTLLNDYGLKASDAAEVTSKMVRATSLGKTTFQDLAGSLHTVSPAAQAAGISLNEVLGAMATMTAKGTPAADAATYLRQTILQLSNPTQKAQGEMQALGLSAIDVSKNLGQRGLTGTLQLLTNAIAQHTQGGTVLVDTLKKAAAAGSGWAQKLQQMSPAEQQQINQLAALGAQMKDTKAAMADQALATAGTVKSSTSAAAAAKQLASAQAQLASAQTRLGQLQKEYGITDANAAAANQQRLAAAETRLQQVQEQLAGKTKLTVAEQQRLENAQTAVTAAMQKASAVGGLTQAQQDALTNAQARVTAATNAVTVAQGKQAGATTTVGSATALSKAQIAQYNAEVAKLPPAARSVLSGLIASKQGFTDLNSTIAKLPPSEQTAVGALATMVGGTKSMQAALELTGESAGIFQDNVGKISKTTTEAGGNVAGWGVVTKNLNVQVAQTVQAIQAEGIKIGTFLIPKVEELMGATRDVIEFVGKHKAAEIALGVAIGGPVALAVGAFAVNTIGKLVGGITNAGRSVAGLGSKLLGMGTSSKEAAATTERANDSQMSSNDRLIKSMDRLAVSADQLAARMGEAFGAAAEEVTAATSEMEGAMLGVETAEEEMATVSEAAGAETSLAFGPIGIALLGVIAVAAVVATHWKQIWGTVSSVATDVGRDLSGAWNDVEHDAQHIWGDIEGFFKQWWPEILGVMTGGVGLIPALLVQHWQTVEHDAQRIWGDIEGFFKSAWSDITGEVTDGVGQVVTEVEQLPSQILGAFSDAGSWLLNAGEQIVQGLWNGISDMGGWLESQVMSFAQNAVETPVKSFFGIFSPSRLMMDHGRNISLGLGMGITAGTAAAVSAATSMSASLAAAATGTLAGGMVAAAAAPTTASLVGPRAVPRAGRPGQTIVNNYTVNLTVQGSVAAEQDLVAKIRNGLLQMQQVNGVLFLPDGTT